MVPTTCTFVHYTEGTTPKHGTRARMTLVYGDFTIRGFEIRENLSGGLWVAHPSQWMNGGWTMIAWVQDPDRRRAFERFVLDAYARDVREQEAVHASEPL